MMYNKFATPTIVGRDLDSPFLASLALDNPNYHNGNYYHVKKIANFYMMALLLSFMT